MTTGPCGETFKEAFSCFVYSKEEPKGSDCLEQFSQFQDCIVSHPELYGPLEDGEPDESLEAGATEETPSSS